MRRLLAFTVAMLMVGPISYAKKNIFAPPAVVIKKPEQEKIVSNNPLQWYSLDAYRLTGIIVSEGLKMAMVVSPDHRTYIVKPGDYLGNRGERIVDITKNAIILKFRDKTIIKPIKVKGESR